MAIGLSELLGITPGNPSMQARMMTAKSPASRLAMMEKIRGANPGMDMRKALKFMRAERGRNIPRSAAGVPGVTARSVQRRKAGKISAFIRNLVYAFSGKPYKANTPATKVVANRILKQAMSRSQAKQFPLITTKDLEVLAKVSRA